MVAASSAGLGFSTAKALAADGVNVVISGRDPDRLAAAAAALPGSHPIRADVSSVEGARALIDESVDVLGGVDILVTNAGGPPRGLARELTAENLGTAVDLLLQSTVAMCTAVVDQMTEQGWGRIVGITSQSVRQPMDSMALSNTVRAAVTSYLKTLANEMAPHGVTVNTVQPGSHRTDRLLELAGDNIDGAIAGIPVGRLGEPDDFGSVVAFVCSRQANFVTGAAISVDGGVVKGLQ